MDEDDGGGGGGDDVGRIDPLYPGGGTEDGPVE